MRNLYFVMVSMILALVCCQKQEPLVVDKMELPVMSFSESFIAQPVAVDDKIVCVTSRGNATYLCKYSAKGAKDWETNIDSFSFDFQSFINSGRIELKIDNDNGIILFMNSMLEGQNNTIVDQYIKIVKFTQEGEFQLQLTDTVHQPKGILVGTELITMFPKEPFLLKGLMKLMNNQFIVLSTVSFSSTDKTLVQVSKYGPEGVFISDIYFFLPRSRNILNVYNTTSNNLFFTSTISQTESSYVMTNLDGIPFFDIRTQYMLNDSYMFFEKDTANFVLSASSSIGESTMKSFVLHFNSQGVGLDTPVSLNTGKEFVALSVKKWGQGLLYTGFTTLSQISGKIDWRKEFTSNEYNTCIVYTDILNMLIWEKEFNGGISSSGALVVSEDPICLYGAKFGKSKKEMFLLKLNSKGNIYSK